MTHIVGQLYRLMMNTPGRARGRGGGEGGGERGGEGGGGEQVLAGGNPSLEEEVYHPAVCSECGTELAMYEPLTELYHFFNVLPSNA